MSMVLFIIVVVFIIIIWRYNSPKQKDKRDEKSLHDTLSRLPGEIFFRWWYNSPKQKGERGEISVHNILSRLPGEYVTLEDVVFKTTKGTTQIDHIVISRYGVFTIETKNYSGEIYGDDNRQEWTQIIVTEVRYKRKWYKTYTHITKNYFYNPVKQSLSHVYAIKGVLHEWQNLRIIPIVVFTGSAILKKVNSQYPVIYEENLLATIQKYSMLRLADEQVKRIVMCLKENNIRGFVDDMTHVRNVQTAKQVITNKIYLGICPKCGGSLVRREGRYGSFYGCSNYPKCKFTTH